MTTIREIERPAETYGRHPRTPRTPGTLGDRLTRRRLELGLTQREVGEAAGVTQECVKDLELNRGYGGTAYTLAGLAKALGVTMQFLWFGDES